MKIYLFHGALSDLVLGDIVHVVHAESRVALQLHHEFFSDLGELFATVQEVSQLTDIERGLHALFRHGLDRAMNTFKKVGRD